ncbi:MAG: hypothetical protein QW597_02125 [Thermoplasmataceae archaeon]
MKTYEKYVKKFDYRTLPDESKDAIKKFTRAKLKIRAVTLCAGIVSVAAVWLLVIN